MSFDLGTIGFFLGVLSTVLHFFKGKSKAVDTAAEVVDEMEKIEGVVAPALGAAMPAPAAAEKLPDGNPFDQTRDHRTQK